MLAVLLLIMIGSGVFGMVVIHFLTSPVREKGEGDNDNAEE
jgi:hypothetical protein